MVSRRSLSGTALACGIVALVLVVSSPAHAESAGITGYSGKTGATCFDCHNSSSTMPLTIYYTGPTNLKPNTKATYVLRASVFWGGGADWTSGLNVAATGGTLAPSAAYAAKIKVVAGELTHAQTHLQQSQWEFNWTSPAASGVYTIHGSALLGDNRGTPLGDITGSKSLVVRVGTCNTTADCDDGDVCTKDSCNTADHSCRNTAVAGCCNLDAECEDGDPCTKNVCSQHKCIKYTTTPCCTADSACADTNPCTKDFCDQATHLCKNDLIPGCCNASTPPCDDGNACTTDACLATVAQCAFTPIPNCCSGDPDCADNDDCTTDTCGTAGVCSNVLRADCCRGGAECDDGDLCTTDECSAGACTHTPVLGCCKAPADCDDGYACTTEACTDNVCVITPVPGCQPPDGGAPEDAMPASDLPAPHDAASADGPQTPPADAGPQADAAPAGDSPAPKKSSDGGCQLAADRHAPAGGLALLAALALLLGVARRTRRSRW